MKRMMRTRDWGDEAKHMHKLKETHSLLPAVVAGHGCRRGACLARHASTTKPSGAKPARFSSDTKAVSLREMGGGPQRRNVRPGKVQG